MASPLRITLVGPYPPPFGGIASHLVSLIPGLVERGVADIAVVSFGPMTETLAEERVTIYRVETRGRGARTVAAHTLGTISSMIRLYSWKLGLRRLVVEAMRSEIIAEIVRSHRSNVVCFYQSDQSLPLAALRPRWKHQRATILTVFGELFDEEAEQTRFLSTRVEQVGALLSSADVVLSSSSHCARSFTRLGLPHKIESVYYGVDIDRFRGVDNGEVRRRLSIPADAIIALFMGRFTSLMGLDSVLEAAPELLRRVPSLTLVLAGARGQLTDRAADLARSSRGRVIIQHDVAFDVQPALYACADIVLAPTRDQHACMGMSIKEAMASGRPVIASDAGGIPEAILPGVTGLLVPLGPNGAVDPTRFVDAVVELAVDPNRRAAIGRAARLRAEKIFSADRTTDRMIGIMKSVLPK